MSSSEKKQPFQYLNIIDLFRILELFFIHCNFTLVGQVEEVVNVVESLGLDGDQEEAEEKQPRATKAQKRRVRLSLRYTCFLNRG